MSDEPFRGQPEKRVSEMMSLIPGDWNSGPISIAAELKGLLASVVDQGTHIDTGGGDGFSDVWFTIGGVEYYATIKPCAPPIERDPTIEPVTPA